MRCSIVVPSLFLLCRPSMRSASTADASCLLKHSKECLLPHTCAHGRVRPREGSAWGPPLHTQHHHQRTFCTWMIRSGSEMGGGVMSTMAGTPTPRRCSTIAARLALYSGSGTCCLALQGWAGVAWHEPDGGWRTGTHTGTAALYHGTVAMAAVWVLCTKRTAGAALEGPRFSDREAFWCAPVPQGSRAAVWQRRIVGAKPDSGQRRRRRAARPRRRWEDLGQQLQRPAGVVACMWQAWLAGGGRQAGCKLIGFSVNF